MSKNIDSLCIDTIRMLAVDAVECARSGHPGMPMGAAPMAYVLWTEFMRHSPTNPNWFNRDRFVLSAGHGSMLLYALLYLTGYDLSLEEIKDFRQWGSRTPGHPEYGVTPGVETTTGPLGQGFGNGVGMAIAEAHLAARFNHEEGEIIDHFTYGIVSDGDLMEGVSHEAASLAGHLGLGKLIYLWDDNRVTIDGELDLSSSESVQGRFAAYGWQVVQDVDGTDTQAIREALHEAQGCTSQPSLICVRTTIGHGSPNKAGTAAAHGAPLGPDEATLTKQAQGWQTDSQFYVPADVKAAMDCTASGIKQENEWGLHRSEYESLYPADLAEFDALQANELPEDWFDDAEKIDVEQTTATRAASGKVLETLLEKVPGLIGGSADLTGSNKTKGKLQTILRRRDQSGSYLYYGVREHAMAAISNGLALHGGLRPYCATFLVFSDYLRPSLRLSAIMGLPVIYIFTHDSIGTGEDGPTHQGIEQIMSLRAIPNLVVLRPADANETRYAWFEAMQREDGPTALILTRQGVPPLTGSLDEVDKGAYIVAGENESEPQVILIGTGSELQYAVDAASILMSEGFATRVVSMPSWELFALQPDSYREKVLPKSVPVRVVVEAAVSLGWERYASHMVCMDRFGASAPGKVLFEQFGFSAERVAEVAKKALAET
ncbi:MAG: transketolase [Rhodothermaceae bacterium]|nr:transketolase [Rhodothermaceae bacterium]MYE62517.1 transketolase [Rhodothermaceae bacterium]MYJ20772.1 transketolase [Rhodothermaceae bacterium]